MFSLNATGARIAELLVDGLEIDAVVAVLTNEYNTTASDVRTDVTNLVDELLSGELIVAIAEGEPHARQPDRAAALVRRVFERRASRSARAGERSRRHRARLPATVCKACEGVEIARFGAPADPARD